VWAPFRLLYEAGEYAEVADRAAAVLADDPPYGVIYYNVACCESLAGRTEDALRHLRRAIELSDRFRAFAKEDSDLEALHGEPEFAELVGE
jgi:tetratricopeptide (TPR) repeat protein